MNPISVYYCFKPDGIELDALVAEAVSYTHLDVYKRQNYHRDYFDMGEFIYERVPVLGSVIRAIKRRL